MAGETGPFNGSARIWQASGIILVIVGLLVAGAYREVQNIRTDSRRENDSLKAEIEKLSEEQTRIRERLASGGQRITANEKQHGVQTTRYRKTNGLAESNAKRIGEMETLLRIMERK